MAEEISRLIDSLHDNAPVLPLERANRGVVENENKMPAEYTRRGLFNPANMSEPVPDWTSRLADFDNLASPKDELRVTLPIDVVRATEIFRLACPRRRTQGDTYAFLLPKGRDRLLAQLPSIATIRSCHEVVLKLGSEEIDFFEGAGISRSISPKVPSENGSAR